MKRIAQLLLLILVLTSCQSKPVDLEDEAPVEDETATIESPYFTPTEEFESRITLKGFGDYITPQNSPVEPERFSGYHTAVDVEFDTEDEVPVRAISDGTVILAQSMNGYGGVMAIQHEEAGRNFISLYGHVAPDSFAMEVGDAVLAGEQIAVLGDAYSEETDGERKHLHFGLIKGTELDVRGYVSSSAELSAWMDPIAFYTASYFEDWLIIDALEGSCPLYLRGQARGPWYFEASFPIRIEDSGGSVIAQSSVMASDEWMTTDFVPFEAMIPYSFEGGDAVLVFEKSNASGLPENDLSFELDVELPACDEEALVTSALSTQLDALSPVDAVLGGHWMLGEVEFLEGNRVHAEYEDGHIAEEMDLLYRFESDGSIQFTVLN